MDRLSDLVMQFEYVDPGMAWTAAESGYRNGSWVNNITWQIGVNSPWGMQDPCCAQQYGPCKEKEGFDQECQTADLVCRDQTAGNRQTSRDGSFADGRAAAICTTRVLHRDPTVRDEHSRLHA